MSNVIELDPGKNTYEVAVSDGSRKRELSLFDAEVEAETLKKQGKKATILINGNFVSAMQAMLLDIACT